MDDKNLPAVETDEYIRERVKASMSGREAADVLGARMREDGLIDIPDSVWDNKLQKKHIETAAHITFALMKGVPGMYAWAEKNPNLFYPIYLKMAAADTTTASGNTLIIQTGMEPSALDAVTLDENGKVINSTLTFRERE